MIKIPPDCTKFKRGDYIITDSYIIELTTRHEEDTSINNVTCEQWYIRKIWLTHGQGMVECVSPEYFGDCIRVRDCTIKEIKMEYPERFI